MFCDQCEQTSRARDVLGCTLTRGTCGKDEPTAALQDLFVHQLTGLAQYATRLRALGEPDDEAAPLLAHGLYSTLTNVNFDSSRFVALITRAALVRDRLRDRYRRATGAEPLGGAADLVPADELDGLLEQARLLDLRRGLRETDARSADLRALILFGLKGMCAYAHHAHELGHRSASSDAALEQHTAFLGEEAGSDDVEGLLARALDLGQANLEAMRLLDEAHTTTFADPTPTSVRITPVAGPAILVSGHDLTMLRAVLEATRGTGINVYTHGELLPAHGYPSLNSYEHLVGNYGGAWYEQLNDFARFPGPIVMTTNCLLRPRPSYRDRIFTTGLVGWPDVEHLEDGDLSPVIESALACPGFARTEPEQTLTVGFGHSAVLGVADTLVAALRSGEIRHLFLVGGCDGANGAREYYTRYAQGAPDDTVVLTLGCAKYRFHRHDFGQVAGLPRLLDLGQCNDAYSAIRIALALADEFACGVDKLPLTLVLSWFEQKAVAVLLTLLSLGVRNISLGPTLPAFLTAPSVALLVERFGLRTGAAPGQDPDQDRNEELAVTR